MIAETHKLLKIIAAVNYPKQKLKNNAAHFHKRHLSK